MFMQSVGPSFLELINNFPGTTSSYGTSVDTVWRTLFEYLICCQSSEMGIPHSLRKNVLQFIASLLKTSPVQLSGVHGSAPWHGQKEDGGEHALQPCNAS